MYIVIYAIFLIVSIVIRTKVLLKAENNRHQLEIEKAVKNKTKLSSGLLIISFTNGERIEEEIKYDIAYKFMERTSNLQQQKLVKLKLSNDVIRVINTQEIQMISLIPKR
ncbi:hypothetical protein L2Z53_11985 (plasmid) [Macrococcoides canis]|uniref:hypothetical protein n=1 Tax=Macrococcoides canis TaxID=1855823 RepID=UPI001F3D88DC|nr:hypothetical protein [Macrococcus canis]UJS29055.1 hypothetical protein L2Z53_11985 [Macrococcus canis]